MTPRRDTSATLAWAGVALLLLVPVWWGVHPTFTWDSDNLAPGQVLRALGQHFRPGWFSVYGPLPYYLMAAACAPVLALFKLTGELGTPSGTYPFGFAHPDMALTAIVVASRLVTVLMALGTVAVASHSLRREHPRAAAWIVPVLLIGSAQFAYYGRTSNVDLHALFWLFLSVMLVETRPVALKPLLGAAAAAACALCSKEQAGPMAAMLVVAAAWRALRMEGPLARRLAASAAVGGAALLTYAVLWELPFNLAGWKAHHAFLFADALGPRKFEPTPAGIAAFVGQCLGYTPLAFGLPVLLGIVLAVAYRTGVRGLGLRALLALVHAVGFLGRIGYVFPRFLLEFLVLALPVAARGFVAATERGRGTARLVTVAALLLALPGGPLLSWLQLTDPRLPAERWIREHVPAGSVIELSGNAHSTLRPPAGYRWTQVMEKTLTGNLHGPSGDIVVVSSIDTVLLIRNPAVRAAWWDEVHAPPPQGRYRVAAVFPRPAVAEWLNPMWISPTITLFRREEAAGAPTAPASAGAP